MIEAVCRVCGETGANKIDVCGAVHARCIHEDAVCAPVVKFQRLPLGDGLPLPAYESDGAAGMDLRAADWWTVPALGTAPIPTGFNVEIPRGYEGQVRLRSSVGRQGLILPNAPGTIDCDYRGEIILFVRNLTLDDVKIERGHRLAQLVIAPVARAHIEEVAELSSTERGAGGFGSTGK